MTEFNHTFEGGVAGAAISTSDVGNGTAWSTLNTGTGGTLTYSTTNVAAGALAGYFLNGSAGSAYARAVVAGHTQHYWRAYTVLTTTTANMIIARWNLAGTAGLVLRFNSTSGKLEVRNASATLTNGTTTKSFVANEKFRWELLYNLSTTAATATLRLFYGANLHGTTPDETLDATGVTTTATADQADFGNISGVPSAGSYWDEIKGSTLGWIGPPAQPTAQVFGDVTAVGWTPTGGTATEVLADNQDSSFLTSPDVPTSSVVDLELLPMEKPAADFTVTVRAQRVNASGGTIVATLRTSDGTQIAGTGSVTVNPSATVGDLVITFPAASIDTEVTQAQWRSGTLLVRLACTATV